jgi:hypothetical protein
MASSSSRKLRTTFDSVVNKDNVRKSHPELKDALDFIEYLNKLNEKVDRPTNESSIQWDLLKQSQKLQKHYALNEIEQKLDFFYKFVQGKERNVRVDYFINEIVSKDMFLCYYRLFIISDNLFSSRDEQFFKNSRLFSEINSKLNDALKFTDDKKKLTEAVYFMSKHN